MNDVVVELNVDSGISETAFQNAVAAFGRWREENAQGRCRDRLAPDLIIKTVWSQDGDLGKQLIFQEETWANQFLVFFRTELNEATALS